MDKYFIGFLVGLPVIVLVNIYLFFQSLITQNFGFGSRSWRYSMLVEDKKIIKLFSEPGRVDNCPDDPFTVSDVDTLLDYLKHNKK